MIRSSSSLRCIVFVSIFIVWLSACSAPADLANTDVVQHTLTDNMAYVRESNLQSPYQTSVGLIRAGNRDTPIGQLPQNREFRIDEGQPLSLDLILNTGTQAVFLVTALVDYEQVPFSLDGESGLLHEIEVEAGKDLFIPVEIQIDDPGAHDLIIIAFKDPYERPMDAEFRISECGNGGFRSVVIVGEDDQPAIAVQPNVIGNPPPAGIDWGPNFLFAAPGDIHPSLPEGQMKLTQEGKGGEVFEYRFWMSNYGAIIHRTIDIGLVRFLNYRQIDIVGEDWLVIHFDGDQEVLLSDSLVLPDKAGVNELQVFYVYNPFTSLLNEDGAPPFVYASPCLGIETN